MTVGEVIERLKEYDPKLSFKRYDNQEDSVISTKYIYYKIDDDNEDLPLIDRRPASIPFKPYVWIE